jgi:pyrophosphatase PpaX
MIRKNKADIDLIIFDLDGTLLDTYLYIVMNYVHLFDLYHKKAPTLETMIFFSGPPLYDILPKYFPEVPLPTLLEEFKDFSLRHSNQYSSLYEKEIPVLDGLREAGYRMAVLTSKSREAAMDNLTYFGLDRYMEIVLALEEYALPKPDPCGVNEILKRTGVKADRAFVIGDSESDILSGNRAHAHTGFIAFGPKHLSCPEAKEAYASYEDIERSFLHHDR